MAALLATCWFACALPESEPEPRPRPTLPGGSPPAAEDDPVLPDRWWWEGEATVDGLSWTGTEALYVPGSTSATGDTALAPPTCLFRWRAQDWSQVEGEAPPPLALPCTDGRGRPCLFSFAVRLTEGEVAEGDCGPFPSFDLRKDGGWVGYGLPETAQNLLYYSPPIGPYPGQWLALTSEVEFSDGVLTYRIPGGAP